MPGSDVSVSPMPKLSWPTRPMTSPGQASSTASRTLPKRVFELEDRPFFFRARMMHRHVALEFPRTDADKRDAIPVSRVHVRLDFENEPGEKRVLRSDG